MVSYIMRSLPENVETVVLAVNYRKDQIEAYFEEHNFGKKIVVNDEPKPLGTGGAVKYAEDHITGRFLVLNSDIICSLSLRDIINFHEEKNAVATISLWPVDNVAEFGVADVKNNGNIVGFVEKPRPEDAPSNLINAGAYVLEPNVLDYIETGRLVSMEKEIFPQLIRETGRFFGYTFRGFWRDIGRIRSYIDIHTFLMKKQKVRSVQGAHCEVLGELRYSCIGDKVYIGENSKLESTVVYDNVEIGEGVRLQDCVVGENCSIGRGSLLEKTMVGDNEHVLENTTKNGEVVWTQPIPEGYPDKQIGNVIEE
jgi:mannose-1-phosphate guanylyltransferase